MIVTIYDDFNLDKILDSGQCFRCSKLPQGYRFITGKAFIYINPLGENSYFVSCTQEEWKQIWIPYFDLERNYNIIRKNPTDNNFLSAALEAGKGIRILRQDPWEMLISFIISQRKSIPAIRKSIELLSDTWGEKISTPYEEISVFPTPEALSKASFEELAKCALGYRVSYIQDAAAKITENPDFLSSLEMLDDTSLLNALKTIKGVGDKVANCVMLFAYARMSSVPIDTWIKTIIENEFDGKNLFTEFGEHAGIIQQYAFYHIRSLHRKNKN